MALCVVHGCNSSQRRKDPNVTLHKFPEMEELRVVWIRMCNFNKPIKAMDMKKARVCSLHFDSNDYKKHVKYELLDLPVPKRLRVLKSIAIPMHRMPLFRGKYMIGCV